MSRKRRNIKNGEHSFGPLTYLVREISKHPVLKADTIELAICFQNCNEI